jgi:hypothetical protein
MVDLSFAGRQGLSTLSAIADATLESHCRTWNTVRWHLEDSRGRILGRGEKFRAFTNARFVSNEVATILLAQEDGDGVSPCSSAMRGCDT